MKSQKSIFPFTTRRRRRRRRRGKCCSRKMSKISNENKWVELWQRRRRKDWQRGEKGGFEQTFLTRKITKFCSASFSSVFLLSLSLSLRFSKFLSAMTKDTKRVRKTRRERDSDKGTAKATANGHHNVAKVTTTSAREKHCQKLTLILTTICNFLHSASSSPSSSSFSPSLLCCGQLKASNCQKVKTLSTQAQ